MFSSAFLVQYSFVSKTNEFIRCLIINTGVFVKKIQSCACIMLAVAIIFPGCGGGGRSSDRGGNETNPGSIVPTTPTSPSDLSDCNNSSIRVSWFSPYHGSHSTLDIQYAGQTQRRQIQVVGLPSGLNDVFAYPFDGITPTASGTTYFATDISPYTGYNLSSVKLDEWKDLNGFVYYRAWVYFPPWAESLPLPSRLNLFSKITWGGGSYKACLTSEKLGLGHVPCYGPDYLTLDCHPICGDGTISAGEECDDGNTATEICAYGENSCTVCNELCFYSEGRTSYCGNSHIDTTNGEVCDNGSFNNVVCDPPYGERCEYCSSSCGIMTNPGPNCGDETVQTDQGEQCDNGDNNDVVCVPSYGSSCTYCDWKCHSQSVTAPRCGDSNIDNAYGEECDDGNAFTESCEYGQASCVICDSSCRLASGTTSLCGDGNLNSQHGEECDDGNSDTESCSYGHTTCFVCDSLCKVVSGQTSYCGDGATDHDNNETCDDGNTIAEDCDYGDFECAVCDSLCHLTDQYSMYCGDGTVQSSHGEECDDKDNNGQDCNPPYGGSCSYCSRECEVIANPGPYCGDGSIQSKWEECDDGALNGDMCSSPPCSYCDWNCRLKRNVAGLCGNGVLDLLEDCDDGNTISGDGCDSVCRFEAKYLVGSFTVNTCNINMDIWDHSLEDGDKYVLYLNGNKYTTGTSETLFNLSNPLHSTKSINLTQCHNVFTAQCISQGLSGPNTASVKILESSQAAKDWTMYCTPPTNYIDCAQGQVVKLTVDVVNNPCCVSQWPVCGNNIVETSEECDDGNTQSGDGCTSTCRNEPVNQLPTASISANPLSGVAPLTVDFTGGCTDTDGICVSYLWDFGDGTPTSSLQNPNHIFDSPGVYTVTLTVTDDDGATNTFEINVTTEGDIIENEWIIIPAGDFVMGCADADGGCASNEFPKHTVMLSEYKIQKYEVTNAQYKACVNAAICTAPSIFDSNTRSPYYGNTTYDNYPVIYVDWNKANTYCSWIGARLPSEAEWEKAARGPSPSENIYPWGDSEANCILANYSGCTDDTEEVGSHPTGASYYGLMDMAGNVRHWVNDWYLDTYYQACDNANCADPSCDVLGVGGKCVDPQGPVTGSIRVMRRSSWNVTAAGTRVSRRNGNNMSDSNPDSGFRCVKD